MQEFPLDATERENIEGLGSPRYLTASVVWGPWKCEALKRELMMIKILPQTAALSACRESEQANGLRNRVIGTAASVTFQNLANP